MKLRQLDKVSPYTLVSASLSLSNLVAPTDAWAGCLFLAPNLFRVPLITHAMTASEELECVAPFLNWIDYTHGAFFRLGVWKNKTLLGRRLTIYRSVFWSVRRTTPAGRWGRAFISSLNFLVNIECLLEDEPTPKQLLLHRSRDSN
jgi:hypothetical protein